MLIELSGGQSTLRSEAPGEVPRLVVLHSDELRVIRSNSLISQIDKLLSGGFELSDSGSEICKVNGEVAAADIRLESFKVSVEL